MSTDPKSSYYHRDGFELVDVLRAFCTPEEFRGWLKAEAVLHLLRSPWKGDELRDLEKAAQHATWLRDELQPPPEPRQAEVRERYDYSPSRLVEEYHERMQDDDQADAEIEALDAAAAAQEVTHGWPPPTRVLDERWPRIVSSPRVLDGEPRIAGTRVGVSAIASFVADGRSETEIRDDYPNLSLRDIDQAKQYAIAHGMVCRTTAWEEHPDPVTEHCHGEPLFDLIGPEGAVSNRSAPGYCPDGGPCQMFIESGGREMCSAGECLQSGAAGG